MQSKGLDFLRPIWRLVHADGLYYNGGSDKGLNLTESDVSVTYTRYVNNYKKDAQPNDQTIDQAIEAKLSPGKKF